jgi:hypothetical protein
MSEPTVIETIYEDLSDESDKMLFVMKARLIKAEEYNAFLLHQVKKLRAKINKLERENGRYIVEAALKALGEDV